MWLRLHLHQWLYAALLITLSAYITLIYLDSSRMLQDDPRSFIGDMVEDTTPKPYVYRTLLPQLTKIIIAITPKEITEEISIELEYLASTDIAKQWKKSARWKGFSSLALQAPYNYAALIVCFLCWMMLILYGYALGCLSSALFPDKAIQASATGLLGLIVLLPFVSYNSAISDFPLLALTTLCLLALYKRQWAMYLITFAVATINKETTIFMIGLFTICFWRHLSYRTFVRLFVAQCLIFVGIISIIHLYFYYNDGDILHYRGLLVLIRSLGEYKAVHLLSFVIIIWLMLARWQELPIMLRKWLWLVPVNILAYILFGWMAEYRVFYPVLPVLTVIAGHTLFGQLDRAQAETA